MIINGQSINDRYNSPPVLSQVGLRVFFIQDGEMFDPYQISAVSLFKSSTNYDPSSVLDQTNELISPNASSYILMNFANSSVDTSNIAFNPSSYVRSTTASGIYRLNKGEYCVVLDGGVNLSGVLNLFGANKVLANACSSTGEYIDIWTVRLFQNTDLETIINTVNLKRGNIFTITQPLMLKTSNRLYQNRITLGSKVDLKIETLVNVENRDISEAMKNVFRDSIVTSPQIEIIKVNEEKNLPARVTVSSFTETSGLVSISPENTLIFNWDTNQLSGLPEVANGTFGSLNGVYYVRVKYNLINQTIVSPPMHLTVD